MISLRSNTACRAPAPMRRAAAPARRVAVVVAAGLGEALRSVGDSFVRIFSKPRDKVCTQRSRCRRASRTAPPAGGRKRSGARACLRADRAIACPHPACQAPNGDWSGTSNPFSGRVDRDRRARPFADGFASKPAAPRDPSAPGTAVQDADAPVAADVEAKEVRARRLRGHGLVPASPVRGSARSRWRRSPPPRPSADPRGQQRRPRAPPLAGTHASSTPPPSNRRLPAGGLPGRRCAGADGEELCRQGRAGGERSPKGQGSGVGAVGGAEGRVGTRQSRGRAGVVRGRAGVAGAARQTAGHPGLTGAWGSAARRPFAPPADSPPAPLPTRPCSAPPGGPRGGRATCTAARRTASTRARCRQRAHGHWPSPRAQSPGRRPALPLRPRPHVLMSAGRLGLRVQHTRP